MPADKKHFIDLKFSKLSPSVRTALKKLSVTELSELADQVNRIYGRQPGEQEDAVDDTLTIRTWVANE